MKGFFISPRINIGSNPLSACISVSVGTVGTQVDALLPKHCNMAFEIRCSSGAAASFLLLKPIDRTAKI